MTNTPTTQPLPCPVCGAPAYDDSGSVVCSVAKCVLRWHHLSLAQWNSLPRRPAWQPIGWVPTEPGFYLLRRLPVFVGRDVSVSAVNGRRGTMTGVSGMLHCSEVGDFSQYQWSNRIMEPAERRGKEGV